MGAAGHHARPPCRRRAPDSRRARCRARAASKPTSCRGSPRRFCSRERLAADEVALVELHDPAEAGLERRGRLVELVPVERQRRLEAQRVARAEADRRDRPIGAPRLEQRVPERAACRRADVELEAVLAGVAGARDQDAARRRPSPRRSGSARSAASDARASALEDRRRARPLQREQRELGAAVDDLALRARAAAARRSSAQSFSRCEALTQNSSARRARR